MDFYQPDQKGLFTFYKEQDQFQQKITKRLLDHQTSKVNQLQQFRKDHEKINLKNSPKTTGRYNNEKNRSSVIVLSKKNEENRIVKTSQIMNKLNAGIEDNKLNRNLKLLKMALKNAGHSQQNAINLKVYLEKLLQNQHIDIPKDPQIRVEKQKKISNMLFLNQILNNPKQSIQSANLNNKNKENTSSKQYNNLNKKQTILKQLYLPNLLDVKNTNKTDKLHLLNKRSYSQKLKRMNKIAQAQLRLNNSLKTRYISPNIKVQEQTYLAPIRTDRKQRFPYALNLQYFNPHRKSTKENQKNQTFQSLLPERQRSQKQFIMRNLVKNIKIK